jgi:hypothetical protein
LGELFSMSEKEVDRFGILKKVISGEMTQVYAAKLLRICDRQVRNLLHRINKDGVAGIKSRHRGKPGNHRKSNSFRKSVLTLMREKYQGFGPTLAKEKLEELDGLKVSAETLRLWMIEDELWTPRKKKRKVHLPRQRRECFGELIQADGSHHKWFGEDHPMVNLNVFIDDATGTITSLYFSEGETLESYFEALEIHLKKYGRPRALYTDRFSVFQTHNKTGCTQMHKALKLLDIELILANSPQAKGRVERANRTLQDRLLKELKLKGIDNISDANGFVPEFIESFNQKFSKKPMSEFDAHRPLEGYDLKRILCRYETRVLLSGSIFQFKHCFYKVQELSGIKQMKGRKVEIRVSKSGEMRVFLQDKGLKKQRLDQVVDQPQVLNKKEVLTWKPKYRKPPSASHPWRKYGYKNAMRKKIKKYKEFYGIVE